MVIVKDGPFDEVGYQELFNDFTNFELSDFQKWAFKAIADGNHALITAPTGSGKTLPAEFMIHLFSKRDSIRKKIIYASPIKALSNQKLHDMRKRFPNISFGLLTGDCKDNPEADVLIMTTEILRNTLFNRKLRDSSNAPGDVSLSFEMNIDTELAGVIFDEVHYIADPERGSVWEQAILMIPQHIPLLMLSATIAKPEMFANWIEKRHDGRSAGHANLEVYLLPTSKRIVPLTHYMWSGVTKGTIERIRDTSVQKEAYSVSNTPILIKDSNGKFNDISYHKINKITQFLYKNYMSPKRKLVLNSLIGYLKKNNLLPALCFIFSRKQVEQAAKEITISLHDDDGIMANTVEKECRKILMSKLSNYKEYIELPEYKNMITLLQKGIAIHHAGIITILREMIEILFDKGYIKLLFATETFAVGINMPTKTVIFTSLEKFDGNSMRYLLPHEYSQMAGRAGRRGIDTRGTVIHCNELFEIPPISDYRNILTGPSQTITSSFRVSYHFVLNILLPEKITKDSVIKFVSNSLLNNDIEREILDLDNKYNKLNNILQEKENILHRLKTPENIIQNYIDINNKLKNATNKLKKRLIRERDNVLSNYPEIELDSQSLLKIESIKQEIDSTNLYKQSAMKYISVSVDNMISFLSTNGFTYTGPDNVVSVLVPGIIASQIQEVNGLVLSQMCGESEGFRSFTPIEIVSIISLLVPINLSEDKKLLQPNTNSEPVNAFTSQVKYMVSKLNDLEIKYSIDSGLNFDIQYDLQQITMDWYMSNDQSECQRVLENINVKGISTGEFIKAILKICNTIRELQEASDMLGYKLLSEKLSQTPENLLKYIVTNQSLYI